MTDQQQAQQTANTFDTTAAIANLSMAFIQLERELKELQTFTSQFSVVTKRLAAIEKGIQGALENIFARLQKLEKPAEASAPAETNGTTPESPKV